MSENALETLVDELYKNGIAVEGYELTGRASGEPKKVLRTVFELNFSEHDKVFEDKIAELKKDYKTASELLGKYQQENESLKQRIDELEKELEEWKEEARVVKKQRDEQLKSFRKGIEPYVDLLHMHETIAELKQHITELENSETENTVEVRVPASPIEIATHLINNTCTINELKMIAEHINVYCNGGK